MSERVRTDRLYGRVHARTHARTYVYVPVKKTGYEGVCACGKERAWCICECLSVRVRMRVGERAFHKFCAGAEVERAQEHKLSNYTWCPDTNQTPLARQHNTAGEKGTSSRFCFFSLGLSLPLSVFPPFSDPQSLPQVSLGCSPSVRLMSPAALSSVLYKVRCDRGIKVNDSSHIHTLAQTHTRTQPEKTLRFKQLGVVGTWGARE